jgi:hypothetical protein
MIRMQTIGDEDHPYHDCETLRSNPERENFERIGHEQRSVGDVVEEEEYKNQGNSCYSEIRALGALESTNKGPRDRTFRSGDIVCFVVEGSGDSPTHKGWKSISAQIKNA